MGDKLIRFRVHGNLDVAGDVVIFDDFGDILAKDYSDGLRIAREMFPHVADIWVEKPEYINRYKNRPILN